MAFPVTINGRTYTLADFEGTNYVDGFPDALEDFVTQAGDIYNSTSTSSVAIGTGSKSFTTADSDKPYQPGTPLRIADAAAPATNFMDCIVTSYSGTSLVVDSIGFGGSGTKSSWTINIGGAKTVDGTLAVNQGGTGATTASGARTNLGLGSIATQDSDSVNIDGGAIDGVTLGGNSQVTVTDADINGGTIDGVTIGGSSAGAVTATTITGSGDMNIDSGTLFVDASENRVGINSTSPSVALQVGSNASGSTLASGDGALSLNRNGDTFIEFHTSGGAQSSKILFNQGGTEVGNIEYVSSSLRFEVNEAEAARFDSSGNLDMTNGGGNIIMANGSGIDFSAQEEAGASSSILHDYEEGTWTPTIFGITASGSPTYVSRSGTYTKIGELVNIGCTVDISNKGGMVGEIRITGLPFTARSSVQNENVQAIRHRNHSLTETYVTFPINSSTTLIFRDANTSVDAKIEASEISDSYVVQIGATYRES